MNILADFPLSEILYYKIGGRAKIILEIHNREDLLRALEFVEKNKPSRVLPIGLGANLLLNDQPFDGIVLWFSKGESSEIKLTNDGLIEVFSSVLLDDIIQFGFSNTLIGLEWAGGLPSTVGGAVRGNVGAFGGEIKETLYKAETFEFDGSQYRRKELLNGDFHFGYRNSVIKQNKNIIISNCYFDLQHATFEEVSKAREVYESHIEYRNKHHVTDYPTCGSVFKNIQEKEHVEKILAVWPDIYEQVKNKWYGKVSMGYIIRRLGFSGFQIGGAQVSEKHANYIMNTDNTSFQDVVTIIEKIKEKFHESFGFYPEPEVEIVY